MNIVTRINDIIALAQQLNAPRPSLAASTAPASSLAAPAARELSAGGGPARTDPSAAPSSTSTSSRGKALATLEDLARIASSARR